MRFIIGIVSEPDPTVFATALPEIEPSIPLAKTAIFAGPPTVRPSSASARRIIKSPAPERRRNAPKSTKSATKVDEIVAIVPKIPSGAKYMRYSKRGNDTPGNAHIPETYRPQKSAYVRNTSASSGIKKPVVRRVISSKRRIAIPAKMRSAVFGTSLRACSASSKNTR